MIKKFIGYYEINGTLIPIYSYRPEFITVTLL